MVKEKVRKNSIQIMEMSTRVCIGEIHESPLRENSSLEEGHLVTETRIGV